MKISRNSFFIYFILFLLVSSCSNQPSNGEDFLVKKIQELENKLDSLKIQLDDQKIKTRIGFMQVSSSLLFNSPWESFLIEGDNYWDNIVDVGRSECSKNCAKSAKLRRNACDELPDGQEKRDCFESSAKLASKCQGDCSNRFPPNLN